MRLQNKVAVITGGSSGIGLAIARAFAQEACTLVITGRQDEKLAAAAKELSAIPGAGKVVALLSDVRDAAAVNGTFDEVRERFGRIDILVNNAGISQRPMSVRETPIETWREMIDINLSGVFLCTRVALPLMARGGTIVNNLSVAARQLFPNSSAYTAAKMGAYGLTLSLREELKPLGIRVTALMAGATSTDIWQQMMPDVSHAGMMSADSVALAVLYAVLLPPEANLSELLMDPTAGAVGARNTQE